MELNDLALPEQQPLDGQLDQMMNQEPLEQDEPVDNLQAMYWVNLSKEEVCKEVIARADRYFDFGIGTGLFDTWADAYYKYYIAENRGGHLVTSGIEGQYLQACYNKYRTLLNAGFSLATNQRLSYSPVAINDSYITEGQTEFTKNILDYFLYTKRNERVNLQGLRWCNLLGEGGVFYDWNDKNGPVGLDTNGSQAPLGDLEMSPCSPVDIIRDPSANSFGELDYLIIRLYKNKYNVAARFGNNDKELITKILGQTQDYKLMPYRFGHWGTQESEWDSIPVYVLLHKKTAARPNGAIVFCLGDSTPLSEVKDLDTTSIPFIRYSYEEVDGTPFATSPSYSLSILQEELDVYVSSALTNASFWGVPNLGVQGGTNASVQDLTGGGKVFASTGGKVEVLNFLQTSPEIFAQIDRIETQMEKLVAISPVLLGVASGDSGTQDAFVAAQSLQFNGPFARSWVFGNEDGGTLIIEMIKNHASTDLLKEIAGEGQSWKADMFKDDPLKDISRVRVELTNPATKTIGGAMEYVTNMVKLGLIKSPELFNTIYNEVSSTGRMTYVSDQQTLELNAKNAISRLVKGEPTPAYRYDNHPVYMQKIVAALNPDIRTKQPQIVEMATAMYQEHLQLWLSLTPAECVANNILIAPQPPPMLGAPGMPAGPQPGTGAAATTAQGPSAKPNNIEPEIQPATMPEAPAGSTPEQVAQVQQVTQQ